MHVAGRYRLRHDRCGENPSLTVSAATAAAHPVPLAWLAKADAEQARHEEEPAPMTPVAPILIGALYVCLSSLIREPHRRQVNAVMVAGAGAAYLSGGGFGPRSSASPSCSPTAPTAVCSPGTGSGRHGSCTPDGMLCTTATATRSFRSRRTPPSGARSATP
jgi:hypothetical protein